MEGPDHIERQLNVTYFLSLCFFVYDLFVFCLFLTQDSADVDAILAQDL